MNLDTIFAGIPIASVLAVISGYVIPFLSALATKAPKFATGAITLALSALAGFVSEWAAAADTGAHYDWRAGLATMFATWVVAVITHSKILAGSTAEASLHAFPAVKTIPDPQQKAA